MLSREPTLTRHAMERATERLKIDPLAFKGWIEATWRDWLPVNAAWLWDRNLRVSAEDRWHFICPWTPRTSVALCVSEDHAIVTVIDYAADVQPRMPRIARPKSALERAARRAFNETDPADVLRHSMGHRVGGPLMNEAVSLYADGARDLTWLRRFFVSEGDVRLKMLGENTRPDLTPGERALIHQK